MAINLRVAAVRRVRVIANPLGKAGTSGLYQSQIRTACLLSRVGFRCIHQL